MSINAKSKSGGWRKIMKWASLPALILFIVVWYDHGIGPSSDTLALRRRLEGTTRVEVSYTTDRGVDDRNKRHIFTLQGDEARDFAHSILLQSPIMNYWNPPYRQISTGEYSIADFYQGSKLIGEWEFIKFGDGCLMPSEELGFAKLYPTSYRHIYRLFEERSRGAAIDKTRAY